MTAVLDHAAELEKTLLKHDVTVFGYERRDDLAIVRFVLNDRKLRLAVTMPDWNADEFRLTPERRELRAITVRRSLYWAAVKKTWDAMKTLIAAKLDGIDAGITTFEDEFSQFADAEALLGPGAQTE